MAQVAPSITQGSDVDYHLDYQFGAWRDIPWYAERWPEMDSLQREVFHLEWIGITESRLRELHRWADDGKLTPPQRTRYEELRNLVAEYRPILERLLQE